MLGRSLGVVFAAVAVAAAAHAVPLSSTRIDFTAPGTQPLSLTETISTPDACTSCHAGFGQPLVEPFRNWQGSMMAQAGRDPLMWAALAVSNQDAPQSGETCLRCHLPKGWLEGRSAPEDGSAMTAEDRHGVQCDVCHRLVDPTAAPGNPAADAAILAKLSGTVPGFMNAMMVVDPLARLRGPFDILADLGLDPHAPARSTMQSSFHARAQICGTCHNLRNPLFTRNAATGEYQLNTMNTPIPDLTKGFPEQSTFDEWAASTYATTGVYAPQFGGEDGNAATCQDCHMPVIAGKDANLGLTRTNVPKHSFAGANTFIPAVLPSHPAFGSEVDATVLQEGITRSTDMLRKAATLSANLASGILTVRVTNEAGHKLPTGYPEGRRMWLHVRAWDASRHVVFESGRYVSATASLAGYGAEPGDADYDPTLHVWEAVMGISDAVAAVVGLPAGPSSHLSLNNVRLKDNRIPPRGFTNAAFQAFDGAPVGATYADGQYWDEVEYPVGSGAVQADVKLYYQTASREYVEFLRDQNTTTAAGEILFDLWTQVDKSTPVLMAQTLVETDTKALNRCRKKISSRQATYQRQHYREWSRCYARSAEGLSCDTQARDARIAAALAKLAQGIGGTKDSQCTGQSLTPSSLGHGSTCPAPCEQLGLFDMSDLATCVQCLAESLNAAALEAAYGAQPPALPSAVTGGLACQRILDKAAIFLADRWAKALTRCAQTNATAPPPTLDCSTDPDGQISAAKAAAGRKLQRCDSFAGLDGCAAQGDAGSVQACMQTAVGSVAEGYTQGAYP